MFYSVNLLRTVAQIALRYYFKEVRGIPEYIGVFAKEKHKYIVEHQKIPTHHTHTHKHTKQISQVNVFSAFLCVGRCNLWGSLKLFLKYAA